jgi:DNA-directed RNA polymerase II subunit RPB2
MFPQEARLRNFTYASPMTIDINIQYITRSGPNLEQLDTCSKVISQIHIGKLPIMLNSSICVLKQYKHMNSSLTGECKYDAGGYFIINGSEKTVLGQERAAENKVYCFNVSKNNTKWSYMAEVKSVPDFKCISPKQINVMISSKNNGFGNSIHIQIPRIKNPIPIFILFRALKIQSDKDICNKIVLDIDNPKYKDILVFLQASIVDAETSNISGYDEAVEYITGHAMYTPINMTKEAGAIKKRDFTIEVLNNDLFPQPLLKDLSNREYSLGVIPYHNISGNGYADVKAIAKRIGIKKMVAVNIEGTVFDLENPGDQGRSHLR